MLPSPNSRCRKPGRPGKVLVQFALLLPVLLGIVGLVIDGGLLLSARREAQNAADAAALAAAWEIFRGQDRASALRTAQAFLDLNGFTEVSLVLNGGAGDALNIPPQDPAGTGSPYKGESGYVEIVFHRPLDTLFLHFFGIPGEQRMTVRAVAGFPDSAAAPGVMVLDPEAQPGLDVNGDVTGPSPKLVVRGSIAVHSRSGGLDQYGEVVSSPLTMGPAVRTPGDNPFLPFVLARQLYVAGGVANVDHIREVDPRFSPGNFDPAAFHRPVLARFPCAPDPLENLPIPSTDHGVRILTGGEGKPLFPKWDRGQLSRQTEPDIVEVGENQTALLEPGIYRSMRITGGEVVFQPGIYVLGINKEEGIPALAITGGRVRGAGVLFYNTQGRFDRERGWDPDGYNPVDGGADGRDHGMAPPARGHPGQNSQFGGIILKMASAEEGTLDFAPFQDAGPARSFNGMLIYQRRWNDAGLLLHGQETTMQVGGTIYAKWSRLWISGSAAYNTRLLVGSMTVTGKDTVTIAPPGEDRQPTKLVSLVE